MNVCVGRYDDAGGAYDHVVPPSNGVPADEAPCRAPCADFDFKRLGPRTTAVLSSPWVQKSSVVQEPRAGPTRTSQFEHSSIPGTGRPSSLNLKHIDFQDGQTYRCVVNDFVHAAATVKGLFNLTAFLTKRDAWAGSFEELLLDAPRRDTPAHLPDAPNPAQPWGPPWTPPLQAANETHR